MSKSVKMRPTSSIIANLGLEPNGKVQKYFTKRCADYMDKYVPKRKGILRQYIIEGTNIVYEQPYARYQYYGVRNDGTHKVSKYTTSGTGPYWDKRMVSAEMDDLVKEVQNYVKRGGK